MTARGIYTGEPHPNGADTPEEKLVTATKGHKLLKDKRDELMRQFLDLVRENMALRQKVEAGIKAANKNFVIAKAGMSEETLHTALMSSQTGSLSGDRQEECHECGYPGL